MIRFIITLTSLQSALELNRNGSKERPYSCTFNPHLPASQQASKSSPCITYLHTGFHFRKEQPSRHHCHEEGVLEFYLTIWKPEFSALASFPTGARGCQNQPGDLFPLWL